MSDDGYAAKVAWAEADDKHAEAVDHRLALAQRHDYLTRRIAAKRAMVPAWDVQWDERERDATAWALEVIDAAGEGDR